MCGIVAVIGTRDAAPLLLDGLRQLEYRGYDSAGIATVQAGELVCLKAEGKLKNLAALVEQEGAQGNCGIGHTRWATHGKPEQRNAHPHLDGSGRVAVVQNGIIENHRLLRDQLQAEGVIFLSDTDTEVIPHLIAKELQQLQAAGAGASGATLLSRRLLSVIEQASWTDAGTVIEGCRDRAASRSSQIAGAPARAAAAAASAASGVPTAALESVARRLASCIIGCACHGCSSLTSS